MSSTSPCFACVHLLPLQSSTSDLEAQQRKLQDDAETKLTSANKGLKDAEELRKSTEGIREKAIHQLVLAERKSECTLQSLPAAPQLTTWPVSLI